MKSNKKMIGAGVGMAAVAAAAGAYFLYGKHGASNRKKIAGWMLKLQGEVLEKMENLKDVNEESYHKLIDQTAKRYGRVKQVSTNELEHLTGELKNAWTHISETLKQS